MLVKWLEESFGDLRGHPRGFEKRAPGGNGLRVKSGMHGQMG